VPYDRIALAEPLDVLADGGDPAREIDTGDHRQGERFVGAFSKVGVDGVDARAVDLDQHLVALGVRAVDLVYL